MNIINAIKGLPVSSVVNLSEHADWFRRLLQTEGIIPRSDSPFYRSLLSMDLYSQTYKNKSSIAVPDADFPLFLREVCSTDYMIRAFHRAGENKIKRIFAGRWNSFRGPDICLTRNAPNSNERDTVWELLTAALCLDFIQDVALDEPDILFTYNCNRWGLACKILHTTDSQHQINRIVEGAKQIESSSAEIGIVVVNVTNQIDHDLFFGPMPGCTTSGTFKSFREPQRPVSLLQKQIQRFVFNIDKKQLDRRLIEDKHRNLRIKTRGVLFFAQTVASVCGVPSLLSMATWYFFRNIEVGQEDFLKRFNHSAQTASTYVL
jgi:hypothetical protein